MKSYVTLAKCVICKEDTGELLLDRRLRDRFEMYTTFPDSVCKTCREKYLSDGVMIINPDSYDLIVLRVEAFTRIFNKPIPPQHIAFCDQEVINRINQSRGES